MIKKFFELDKRSWLFLLGIYLFAGGLSFGAFSFWQSEGEGAVSPLVQTETDEEGNIVFTGPKDQECPLNGVMYTAGEKEIWESRRPMAIMIENHEDSRPHSGLYLADIVYEVVAEGGITRFMGIYYCGAAAQTKEKYNVGPVRSARTYFLDWVSEYGSNPLYLHVGGAGQCSDISVDERAKALCQIEKYGWKDRESWNDMDQFALPYQACRREPERTGVTKATEHTMYCDTNFLWDYAREKRELGGWPDADRFRNWLFKDDQPLAEPEAKKVSFDFWQGYKAYSVIWDYDEEGNVYLRENGGRAHTDFLTGEQLEAKVVVVQFAKETGPLGEHKHLLYGTIGKGKALVFQDGGMIEGQWSKNDRISRTIFFDSRGKEIQFNRGQIWIEVLPLGNKVDYGD